MPPPPSAERSRSRRRRPGDIDERARRARAIQQEAADTSRRTLERAAVERDAAWRRVSEENRRRAGLLLAVPFVPGVLLAVLGVLLLPLLLVGLLLVVVWAVAATAAWRSARSGFAGRLRAQSAEEAVAGGTVSSLTAARFADVTESLCAALGLPLPRLGILVEPAVNAVCSGVGEAAWVVCTSGLLESLERIELEGVVAHELVHLKRLDTLTSGLSTALLRGGRLPGSTRVAAWLEGPSRELDADLAAVGVTRYPPGLIAGLQAANGAAGAVPTSVAPRLREETASSWFVPLNEGAFDVDERLEILVEL